MRKKTVRRNWGWFAWTALTVYATVKAVELAQMERGAEALGGELLTPVLMLGGAYLVRRVVSDLVELFWMEDPYDDVLR